MTDIKLDIIIPAYKCNTLPDTLLSLSLQTNQNFNVYVILDGVDYEVESSALGYMPKDIIGISKVITKEHSGVGPTRNYGLNHSDAEYVMFLDADDLLLPNAVQTVYNAMETGFDYMIGKTMREAENGNFEVVGSSQVTWIHGRAYRREFLNKYGIRFPALSMCEDLTFNMLCSEFAQRIPETQWPIHIQRYTHGSASRNENSERTQAITYIQACMEYLKQANKFRAPDECIMLPAAIAACYWYLDGADTVFADDYYILNTMSKQFIELLDESGYNTSTRLQKAMPMALHIPARPFGSVVPQTLTFEQRIINAMGRTKICK